MSDFETTFIDKYLRPLIDAEGAERLRDDVAIMASDGVMIVTMDTIVSGVHFLPNDPLETVAWKALAVNVSDIAAKGAFPVEALVSVIWPDGSEEREAAVFARGLGKALQAFNVQLVGGDTVMAPQALSVTVTMTGRCVGAGPIRRSGGKLGDHLYVFEPQNIGLAGVGLKALHRGQAAADQRGEISAYRTPFPRAEQWAPVIARHAHASLDVSDGLLIDAGRLADASGLGVEIELDHIGVDQTDGARISLATAGDDYVPLVAAPPDCAPLMAAGFRRVGRLVEAETRRLICGGRLLPWPDHSGFVHGRKS